MNKNHADGQSTSQGGNKTGLSSEDKQNQNEQSGSHGSGNPAGQKNQGGGQVQKQRGEGDKQYRLKGDRESS